MNCQDIKTCIRAIDDFFDSQHLGYPLIVCTENSEDYTEILHHFRTDSSKSCIFVSDYCSKDGLPDVSRSIRAASRTGNFILFGVSQALMLGSESELFERLSSLVNRSVSGQVVVVLSLCRHYLARLIDRDIRLETRVIFLDGQKASLPSVRIAPHEEGYEGGKFFSGIKSFLEYFDTHGSEVDSSPADIIVSSSFSSSLFANSVIPVRACDTPYDQLCSKYPTLSNCSRENYGTNEQWSLLLSKSGKIESFNQLLMSNLPALQPIDRAVSELLASGDADSIWSLWLLIKAEGCPENEYLERAVAYSDGPQELESSIYYALIDIDPNDSAFCSLYHQRKQLLSQMKSNNALMADYCDLVGSKGQKAIFYFTDIYERERVDFIRCLANYEYSEEEVIKAATLVSPEIAEYLLPFTFDSSNTDLSNLDRSLWAELTRYFHEYKFQKITNRVAEDFIEKVNSIATERPYNKLRARSSIIRSMDRDAQLFFFDAFGVEYLSFVEAKCAEYGLTCEITVARGELPSITCMNKEFEQYFPTLKKIDSLDELKHHTQKYDYQTCREPIHMFDELELIDSQIKMIHSQLTRGDFEKAVVVSDHGASRLAVLFDHENDTKKIELDEKGKHSGRCCPCDSDPNIPYCAFENGYAVLANYERFKGGRRANLEVHGGATLEEVLVPVITLQLLPRNCIFKFENDSITLRQKEVATLVLYSSEKLHNPRIRVRGRMYEGTVEPDPRRARFELPDLKRSGDFEAEIFDGNICTNIKLGFSLKKATAQEIDFF